jgi:hypothetical protein
MLSKFKITDELCVNIFEINTKKRSKIETQFFNLNYLAKNIIKSSRNSSHIQLEAAKSDYGS